MTPDDMTQDSAVMQLEKPPPRHHRFRLTRHAVAQFRKRVRPELSRGAARMELIQCLCSARPEHTEGMRDKSTAMVPLGCCTLVCDHGAVVTVLQRREIACPHCAAKFAVAEDMLAHVAEMHLTATETSSTDRL